MAETSLGMRTEYGLMSKATLNGDHWPTCPWRELFWSPKLVSIKTNSLSASTMVLSESGKETHSSCSRNNEVYWKTCMHGNPGRAKNPASGKAGTKASLVTCTLSISNTSPHSEVSLCTWPPSSSSLPTSYFCWFVYTWPKRMSSRGAFTPQICIIFQDQQSQLTSFWASSPQSQKKDLTA